MINDKHISFIVLSSLYLVLSSTHAWYFWFIPASVKGMINVVILLYFIHLLISNREFISDKFSGFALIFCFLGAIWNTPNNIYGVMNDIVIVGLFGSYLALPSECKEKILESHTKWIAIILSLGVIFWTINLFVSLPNLGLMKTDHPSEESIMYNYGFFTLSPDDMYRDFPRFRGVFFEPGHTAILACFYVFANKYDFHNKYVTALSICILPTLSLAGYILWVLGYFLVFIAKRFQIISILKIVVILFCIMGGYYYGINYNNGNNSVNTLILQRLIIDEEGNLAGNNRTTWQLDNLYDKCINDGSIITGIDNGELSKMDLGETGNSGYKLYLIQRGIIGTLLVFLSFFFIAKRSLNKKWGGIVMFFFVCVFLQRSYPLWASWWLPFFLMIEDYSLPEYYQEI